MTVTGQWLAINLKMTWATVISDPSGRTRITSKHSHASTHTRTHFMHALGCSYLWDHTIIYSDAPKPVANEETQIV